MLDAPVLPTELNLKVQNRLPIAKKAKVTGLYHSGMYGPHADLMQFIALDLVKWVTVDDFVFVGPVEGVAHRLCPWAVNEFNAKIFGYLNRNDSCTLEKEPLEKLARDGELMVFAHTDFWQCMDTVRDMNHLNDLWKSGNAPWKIWKS